MRLVDANLPFQVVYSTFHHEYLGYLISAHVVQILPNGELSLVHQGLHPDSMSQFEEGLTEHDAQLIRLITEISPRQVVKRFGGNPRDEHGFFTTRFTGEIIKLVDDYIQKRLGKIFPQLIHSPIYEMGNDGYPAQYKIEALEEPASVLFHFRRKEEFTRYYPTIKLNGEKIDWQKKGAVLLCTQPAWMLLDGKLFTFSPEVDGKKLRPFLKRENIIIQADKEDEYYRKFVTQIVEKYPVFPKGFEILDHRAKPSFHLTVKEHDQSSFSFIREVDYEGFRFPLDPFNPAKAIYERENQEIRFHRIHRLFEEETEICQFFEKITPNKNSLTPWEYVNKEKGLAWLSTHTEEIKEAGISIRQENPQYQLNLNRPSIELNTKEEGDWFDIQAVVVIGEFRIPFIKFRNHILRGQREYTLPDGSIAILPDEWFSDYRHLLEVSETREDDILSIRKYQAPLLNFPSQPSKTREKLVDALKQVDEIPEIDPPQGLKAQLRNYQQAGFNWLYFMKENGMGAILADDMGLGKTLQTLSLLLKEQESGITTPTLVVLPTSLIHNWKNEAQKFTPALKIYIHTGVNRIKDPAIFQDYHLILTTYGIVRQDITYLQTFPFHYIVLDESQMIKNPESKTAKAIRKLISRHRLSLTGTPIENTVMDVWSQMAFLNPGLLGNESFFKRFYVGPIEKEHDVRRSAKLRRIIYPYILRRKKQQVEKQLPARIEKLHFCGMAEPQKDLYEETRSTYRNYLLELINQGAWKKNKLNILTGLQKLRQIAIHPQMIEPENYQLEDSGKYQEVKRLLRQILTKKRSKVLIFSQFVKMLQIIKSDLEKEGIPFAYLDGGTKDRQKQVDNFQEDQSLKVFLISLKAGGVGLNLTAADYVFILDPWWNPAVENQAIDRSHRIGQTRTVFYYKFITEESIEEKILKLQQRKSQLSDDIIQIEEDVYKSLNEVDLGVLLQ
ncbi:MAG: DEAD/DEAH box helicase [Bacteroidota bacterium]